MLLPLLLENIETHQAPYRKLQLDSIESYSESRADEMRLISQSSAAPSIRAVHVRPLRREETPTYVQSCNMQDRGTSVQLPDGQAVHPGSTMGRSACQLTIPGCRRCVAEQIAPRPARIMALFLPYTHTMWTSRSPGELMHG